MKIMFVWRRIDRVVGGVERMLAAMMNDLAERGHDVSLFTWDLEGATSYYKLDDRIVWHKLNCGDPVYKAGLLLRLKRAPRTRAIIRKARPDVMICFESGIFISMRMFLLGFKIPMIAAERNAPSRHEFSPDNKTRDSVFKSLAHADRITIQFDRYRNGYPEHLRTRMKAIPNPVRQADRTASPAGLPGHAKTLLCVARLEPHQKNVAVLIRAFGKIAGRFPDWTLVFAGGGSASELKAAADTAAESGIEGRVRFSGETRDVENMLLESHLFCLPSRYEGFPNALAEALSHGLPAVGFEGCAGVADLIQPGVTGLLAKGNNDPETLAESLATLMSDDALRARMGKAAHESMKAYMPKNVFDQWEQFFLEVAGSAKAASLPR